MAIALNPVLSGATGPFPHAIGDHWMIIGKLAFSGSYSTGGDALDLTVIPSEVGVGIVDKVTIDTVNGYLITYDYTNKKVKVWDTTTDAEFAAGAYSAALLAATPSIMTVGR